MNKYRARLMFRTFDDPYLENEMKLDFKMSESSKVTFQIVIQEIAHVARCTLVISCTLFLGHACTA